MTVYMNSLRAEEMIKFENIYSVSMGADCFLIAFDSETFTAYPYSDFRIISIYQNQ